MGLFRRSPEKDRDEGSSEEYYQELDRRDQDGMYASVWDEQLDDESYLAELLDRVLARLEASDSGGDMGYGGIGEPKTIHLDYEFFPYEDEREELFEYCKKLAEYLYTTEADNLVIVDRSARPIWVGVKEYWKAKYPDEPMPGIYFLNPKGFRTLENTSVSQADMLYRKSMYSGEPEEFDPTKTDREIEDELKKVYKRLLQDKDKKTVLFDACMHKGETLAPVVNIMKQAGFSDMQIVVVSPDMLSPSSPVKPDHFLTERMPARRCYPFDQDQAIEKTYDHVYSLPAKDPEKIRQAARLRKEIRDIIRSYISVDQDSPDNRVSTNS